MSTVVTRKKTGSNCLVVYVAYQQNPKVRLPDESQGDVPEDCRMLEARRFMKPTSDRLRDLAHPLRNDPA